MINDQIERVPCLQEVIVEAYEGYFMGSIRRQMEESCGWTQDRRRREEEEDDFDEVDPGIQRAGFWDRYCSLDHDTSEWIEEYY